MFLRRLCSTITAISVAVILAVVAASLNGCAMATLTNKATGDSVTFKGAKVFSPTVLSLRSGNCSVPAVDSNGVVTQPAPEMKTTVTAATATTPVTTITEPSDKCQTEIAQVNGVDVKGLTSTIMAAVLSAMASIATGA